jgi:hypothetical protein
MVGVYLGHDRVLFYDFTDLSLGKSPILTLNKEIIPSFFADKLYPIVLVQIHCDLISFVTEYSGVLHSQPLIEAQGPVIASLNESRSERNGT